MDPDRELLSILYKPTFDDNRGRPPFKLFDDRFMIVELSNTSDKSPSIELEYKLRYSILDTKLQNLFPSSNEIFEFTIVRDVPLRKLRAHKSQMYAIKLKRRYPIIVKIKDDG